MQPTRFLDNLPPGKLRDHVQACADESGVDYPTPISNERTISHGGRAIDVWFEELAVGGRIELQNFLVLEVQRIDRGERRGMLISGQPRRVIHRLVVRPSKQLRDRFHRL